MRRKPPVRLPAVALELRRHPRARDALVAVLAVGVGAAVLSVVHRADQARSSWGDRVAVVVATRDVEAGEPIDASNTTLTDRPSALVPPGALRERPDGARLATPVLVGDVLRAGHLAPAGASEVAARLPAGSRAVAIPVEAGTAPSVVVGDRVDVVVALAPEAEGGGPPGFVLAAAVEVVDVTDVSVTVAVSPDVAPRIAVALGRGAVTVALVGAT